MNCPRCNEPTEAAAAYCGNCGFALHKNLRSKNLPAYAIALPAEQLGNSKATLSLLAGVAGLIACLFMALVGLLLGLFGLMMATMSRTSQRRIFSNVGLLASSLAILLSLGIWAYTVRHQPVASAKALPTQTNETVVAASEMSTPCYKVGFINSFNISRATNSCNLNAYNGQSFENSSVVYKIYANQTQLASASSFGSVAKQAIEKDIKNNLPGFTIDREQVANFAGSPAYVVNASHKDRGIAIVEAAVLHPTNTGDNVFVLLHANGGSTSDFDDFEAQWEWK